jgi:UDP-glucose 4-epimerase
LSKIVITGADGFIGTALARRLSKYTAVVGVNHTIQNPSGCETLRLDLRTPGVLDPVLEPGALIFHLAGSANVRLSVDDPVHDLGNTFQTTFEVLESARKAGAKVIFASTASIYDISAPLPFREGSPARPSSPYGAAKLSAENYCIAYHRSYGMDTRIARMTSVYGPGMGKFVITEIVEKIAANPNEITLLGDGNQIRDFLYIEDAVDALLCIASSGEGGNEYNVGSGRPMRILDLIDAIAAAMGYPNIRKQASPVQPGYLEKSYVDISKVRSIGFEPKVDFLVGLARTITSLTALKNAGVA